MYSCHLFLISSVYVRSTQFMFFTVAVFAWSVLLLSLIFWKRYLVFPVLLFSSISLHWSLRRLSCLSLLFFGTLHSNEYIFFFSPLPFTSLLFTAICKPSTDSHFSFFYFFFLGMVLIPASRTISQTSTNSSSGTLSDLIPWICLSLLLYNCKGFDLGHTWIV